MFRTRIIGLAVAAVVLLGAGVYLWSTMSLREWGEERVSSDLDRAQRLMDRLKSLDVADLVADTKKWAASDELRSILRARMEAEEGLDAPDEDGDDSGDDKGKGKGKGARGAKDKAPVEDDGAAAAAEPEDLRIPIVGELAALEVRHKESYHLELVLDHTGSVLARAKQINWNWNGRDFTKAYPASSLDDTKTGTSPIITAAIHREPGADVWFFEENMVLTAAAPVIDRDEVVGVVVLARHLSGNYAEADKAMLGVDVAYLLDSKIHGTTLSSEAGEDLADALEDDKGIMAGVLGEDRSPSTPTILTLKGTEYLSVVAPYPGDASTNKAAYAVLVPVDEGSRPIDFVVTPLLILGGAVLLLCIVLGIVLSQGMERPVTEIESGILEVISGNHDYKFRGESYLAGVGQQLNIMVAMLLGKPLPDEEAEAQERRAVTGEWADPLFIDEDAVRAREGDGAVDPAVARNLAGKVELEYLSELFKGYTNARSNLGQPMGGVTIEKFSKKIKNNETMLKRKYNVEMVRFLVQVKGGSVILQPVLLDADGNVVDMPGA